MKIIFLDMDGVLNSQRYLQSVGGMDGQTIDRGAVALLDKIIDSTGASVVISSSWRHMWHWQQMREILRAHGLRNFDAIIDQTPDSGEPWAARGQEVQEWLDLERERRVVSPESVPVSGYVILDDNDGFTTEQLPHFVRTDANVGLTPRDAIKAISILNSGA